MKLHRSQPNRFQLGILLAMFLCNQDGNSQAVTKPSSQAPLSPARPLISNFVCNIHQMVGERPVGRPSEAETRLSRLKHKLIQISSTNLVQSGLKCLISQVTSILDQTCDIYVTHPEGHYIQNLSSCQYRDKITNNQAIS